MRDVGSEETIRQIAQGFKLKMDDMGNILIKRLSKSPVYARSAYSPYHLAHNTIGVNPEYRLKNMTYYQNLGINTFKHRWGQIKTYWNFL